MNVARPYGVISHPLDSEVLHVLAGADTGLTGRRIARLANGGTQQGISKALSRLSEEGLVERQVAGSSILFKLNRGHLAAAPIVQLMRLREELVARLAGELSGWAVAPVHASLFGSAARGDGDAGSDIDLFIVRPAGVDADAPDWRKQLEMLAAQVETWTGNRAGIVDVSEDALDDLRKRRPAVVEELEGDALRLVGPEPTALLESRS